MGDVIDVTAILDPFYDFPFLIDLRLERRRWEVYAGDATVAGFCGPTPAAAVG